MSQFPATAPGALGMRPHRGTLILVLGILRIVISCTIAGIIAWVMGNGDLKAMDAGQMDPSGRSITNVGRVLGIVSVCLTIVLVIGWVLIVVVFGGIAIFGAGAAGAGAAGSP